MFVLAFAVDELQWRTRRLVSAARVHHHPGPRGDDRWLGVIQFGDDRGQLLFDQRDRLATECKCAGLAEEHVQPGVGETHLRQLELNGLTADRRDVQRRARSAHREHPGGRRHRQSSAASHRRTCCHDDPKLDVMSASDHAEYVNIYKAFPAGYQGMQALEDAAKNGPLDPVIRELVKLRASQINGCAYCIDMHHKDARAAGESEERLYMLPAWREATVYTDAERAALALTEEITLIADGHVPADVEAEARAQFDAETYAALVFVVVAINAWNRLAITSHSPAGIYQPRATAERLTASATPVCVTDIGEGRRSR